MIGKFKQMQSTRLVNVFGSRIVWNLSLALHNHSEEVSVGL